MLPPERIQKSVEFVEWLRQSVHDQSLPDDNRTRVACSCFAITQDHHHAIVLLVKNRLYASSFALLRLEFEAYIRGLWVSLCANESQITNFISKEGWEPPSPTLMLSNIEENPGFSKKVLSIVKDQTWKLMCDYTHTGVLHVQRWNTASGIEPNYPPDEVEGILGFSEIIGAMSVASVAQFGGKQDLALSILSKIKETNIYA